MPRTSRSCSLRNSSASTEATIPAPGFAIAATDFGCLAQGLSVGQIVTPNPAGQYNGLLGGNPNLQPEKGTTWTIGIVIQPSFFPRLALTVDWWNIKVKDAIQGYGADAIVAACVAGSTATIVSPACALIHRDAAGSLWLTSSGFVIDTPVNTSTMKNAGLDVNDVLLPSLVRSRAALSWSFIGTWMDKHKNDNGLSEPYDCVGFYGPICSGGTVAAAAPIPEWRHKLRTTWTSNFGLGLSLAWRHVGKVKAETLQDNVTVGSSNNFDPGLHIKAQNYLDLAATYTVWDRVNLRAGVNNLTDNDPPLVTGATPVPGHRTFARPVRVTATPIRVPGTPWVACCGLARRSTSCRRSRLRQLYRRLRLRLRRRLPRRRARMGR